MALEKGRNVEAILVTHPTGPVAVKHKALLFGEGACPAESRPTGLASLGFEPFDRVAPHLPAVGLGDVEPGWAQIDAWWSTLVRAAIITSPSPVNRACDSEVDQPTP